MKALRIYVLDRRKRPDVILLDLISGTCPIKKKEKKGRAIIIKTVGLLSLNGYVLPENTVKNSLTTALIGSVATYPCVYWPKRFWPVN